MKNTKKIVLGGVCALALVTGSVMGTMAYLTSKTEAVENAFTVGNVAITLDEANTDENGTTTSGRGNGNRYKLMPGHTYTKDPTVHVAEGSEDCYLFVTVKDDLVEIEGATTVAQQIANNGWTKLSTSDGTDVYVLGTKKAPTPVAKKSDHKVFETLTIDSGVTNETIQKYSQSKTITVTAYAIQKDGFDGKPSSEIWTAIDAK